MVVCTPQGCFGRGAVCVPSGEDNQRLVTKTQLFPGSLVLPREQHFNSLGSRHFARSGQDGAQ